VDTILAVKLHFTLVIYSTYRRVYTVSTGVTCRRYTFLHGFRIIAVLTNVHSLLTLQLFWNYAKNVYDVSMMLVLVLESLFNLGVFVNLNTSDNISAYFFYFVSTKDPVSLLAKYLM